ncbi:RfaF ADP-heptose,LPS heptosyltransferase [Burkholderiales bacterium]
MKPTSLKGAIPRVSWTHLAREGIYLLSLVRAIKKTIFLAVDLIALQAFKVPETKKGKLYVRLDAIGDYVLWASAITRTTSGDDSADATLICSPGSYKFIESLDIFPRVIVVDPQVFVKSLSYRLRILKEVSTLSPEIAIQPTYSRVLLTGDAIIRASRARYRVGFDGDLANRSKLDRWIGDKWYTSLIKPVGRVTWEEHRNIQFMQRVRSSFPGLYLAKTDRGGTADSKGDVNQEGGILIFPGSGSHKKMWPITKYIALVEELKKVYPKKIYICGTQSERALGSALCSSQNQGQVVNLVGAIDWTRLLERISKADLIIGNDSACVHLASYLGAKSISILGGGHFGRFLPYPKDAGRNGPECIFHQMECYGCDWKCMHPHARADPYPCIELVSVSDVMNRAVTLLKSQIL